MAKRLKHPVEVKTRSDATLKRLERERQDHIIELFERLPWREVLAELHADGIEVGKSTLYKFVDWYAMRKRFEDDEQTVETMVEQLKEEVPGITEEQIDAYGQRAFSLLAIRNEDADTFVKVRTAREIGLLERAKLELKKQAEKRHGERLKLEQKRFQRETAELFLKWYGDKRAKEIVETPGASRADQIEKLGQTMFGDLW